MSRFCIDEDMPVALADRLTALGHSAIAAKTSAQLRGSGDEVVFLAAVRDGRTVVSHNERHFMLLHRAWRHWPLSLAHAGVLLVPQMHSLPVDDMALSVLEFLASGAPLNNRLYRLYRLQRRGRRRLYAWEEPRPT